MHYLNEFDQFAAEWLRGLMRDGAIPQGTVDERSIKDVKAADLVGYKQCHFFAGIGGWPLAFRLAGISPDCRGFSGSCPCQPFSDAGKGLGTADPRHLWPDFCGLIAQCEPPIVVGEQVASKDGRHWVAGVRADLEALGYAVGVVDLCAAGVGSPHIRQRLWWGAVRISDSGRAELARWRESARQYRESLHATNGGRFGFGISDRKRPRLEGAEWIRGSGVPAENASGIPNASCQRIRAERPGSNGQTAAGMQGADRERQRVWPDAGDDGSGLRDTIDAGLQGYSGHVDNGDQSGRIGTDSQRSASPSDPWSDYTIGHYRDGKARRIGRGVFPLANGIPRSMGQGQPELRKLARSASQNRVGRLKGYGNAIVPQVAAVFLQAFMESF